MPATLSTAYNLARDKEWDTFQIDNHFARYLLIAATETATTPPAAMANFRKARSIVNRQMRTERLHYPYRVASWYEPLLDRYSSAFSVSELDELKTAAGEVLLSIDKLPEAIPTLTRVHYCRKAMDNIVARAGAIIEERSKNTNTPAASEKDD